MSGRCGSSCEAWGITGSGNANDVPFLGIDGTPRIGLFAAILWEINEGKFVWKGMAYDRANSAILGSARPLLDIVGQCLRLHPDLGAHGMRQLELRHSVVHVRHR